MSKMKTTKNESGCNAALNGVKAALMMRCALLDMNRGRGDDDYGD
jgi:hypothetical protein